MNGSSSAPWADRTSGRGGLRFLAALALAGLALLVAIPLTVAIVQSAVMESGVWFPFFLAGLGPWDLLALGVAVAATGFAVRLARRK